MKNILIPTDFSENSKDALDYAISLFKGSNVRFYILNTYDQLVASDHFDVTVATNMKTIQLLKENSDTQLKAITTYLKNKNSELHQIETLSKIGTLIGAIKEIVEEKSIDLIVMGTKGETSSSNIFFGSNTIQVINTRIAPVLAVPAGYKFKPLRNILFPTDLQIALGDRHLKLLLAIAKERKCKITLLHKLFRGLNSLQRAHRAMLEKYLAAVDFSFETIEDKEIDDAVFDYERKHPTDLLAMINNKHSFLENLFFKPVVSKIVKDTDIPFLVIPS